MGIEKLLSALGWVTGLACSDVQALNIALNAEEHRLYCDGFARFCHPALGCELVNASIRWEEGAMVAFFLVSETRELGGKCIISNMGDSF